MFGRKQRIIETQAALIADLREEIEHKNRLISTQRNWIATLQDQLSVNGGFTTSHYASNIDFKPLLPTPLPLIFALFTVSYFSTKEISL